MAQKPAYQPKFQAQLDGCPTAGNDCAVRTVSMGCDYETFGAIRPSVKDIRNRCGVPSKGLTTAQMDTAVSSYDTEGETKGYTPLTFNRKNDNPWSELVDAVIGQGRGAGAFLNYAWVNDNLPKKSGDPNFRGTHSVFVCGWSTKDDGTQQIKVWDPLCDGRRSGIPGPGPIWYDKGQLQKATGAVVGSPTCNRWRGGLFKPAEQLEPPDPCGPSPQATKNSGTGVEPE